MPPAGSASTACRVWEVSGQGEGLLALLFPHLAGLRVDRVEDTGDAVVISALCRAASACCPRCGQESSRVHGGYSRVVADGAAGGRPVLIALRVRRFRCQQPSCPQITFAEQAQGLTSRYRRRSVPLMAMLAGFGLELAGRAAARLAGRLGVAVHPSTVLRLVAALPEPKITAAPEVLGVDDFALRKGRVYGTVLVDIDTGDVVDLLPDREAATLETWLKAHPGATIICRDRAGAYAEGARNGAPDAAQVADRWHLWHNLAEYAGKTVARHRSCLTEPAPGGAASPPGAAGQEADQHEQEEASLGIPGGPGGGCGTQGRLVARTQERHAAIHELLAAGESLHAISRILDFSRPTVRRFARAASPADLLAESIRESGLDPFKPYVCQRWNEGLTDATALHAELQERGYTGSVRTLRRYVAPFRQDTAAPDPAPAVPKARQITRWLLSRPEHLTPEEQAQLAAIRGRCPHIDALPLAHQQVLAQPAGIRVDRPGRPPQIGPDLQPCRRLHVPADHRPLLPQRHRAAQAISQVRGCTGGTSSPRQIPRNF
jgi:Transposase/zinc-finger of transposase IS204/IS1001/IS1096/IS1165